MPDMKPEGLNDTGEQGFLRLREKESIPYVNRMTWLQYFDRWAVVVLAFIATGLAAMIYGCAG